MSSTVSERQKIYGSLEYFRTIPQFRRCVVLLDNCYLEIGKVQNNYRLLNADDHRTYLKRKSKNPSLYRPDILHSCLLALMDSPLNKHGLLEIFIRTHKNVLIKMNPLCRIPRTIKRFSGLMVQLLHQFVIRSADKKMILMKVVKNDLSKHLPMNCLKVGTSVKSKVLVNLMTYIPMKLEADKNKSIMFVIGAFAHGQLETKERLDEEISISKYGLSASVVCSKIVNSCEQYWEIL